MKLLPVLVWSLLTLGSALAYQGLTDPGQEALQQLQSIRNGQNDAHAIRVLRVTGSTVLPAGSIANASVAQLAQTTATTGVLTTTAFTPDFVGQILVQTVSNKVWVATGATSNGWTNIK